MPRRLRIPEVVPTRRFKYGPKPQAAYQRATSREAGGTSTTTCGNLEFRLSFPIYYSENVFFS